MKSETIHQIESMDDFRLLRFFNYFSNTLFNKVDVDMETIMNQLPQDVKNISEMQTVINHEEQYSMLLDQKEAIEFARTSLLQLANNENFEPALAEAIKNYRDDEMPAAEILALGAAVSFILLLATSKISYKSGKGWVINIGGEGTPEKIVSKTALVKELFNVIPNSILKLVGKN